MESFGRNKTNCAEFYDFIKMEVKTKFFRYFFIAGVA